MIKGVFVRNLSLASSSAKEGIIIKVMPELPWILPELSPNELKFLTNYFNFGHI